MMNAILISVLLSCIYIALDLLNFKVLARKLYASFYTEGVTNFYAAATIYLLYPLVVMYLTKAATASSAVAKGAVLGATGYGLYHLTNMATMARWPVGIAAYDTAWGVLVTMLMAVSSMDFPGCLQNWFWQTFEARGSLVMKDIQRLLDETKTPDLVWVGPQVCNMLYQIVWNYQGTESTLRSAFRILECLREHAEVRDHPAFREADKALLQLFRDILRQNQCAVPVHHPVTLGNDPLFFPHSSEEVEEVLANELLQTTQHPALPVPDKIDDTLLTLANQDVCGTWNEEGKPIASAWSP